jgi:hypothetical protein
MIIKNPAMSMTPLNHLQLSHWDYFTKMFKSDPAVSMTPRDPNFSNDYLDFLGEYEVIGETGNVWWKKPRVKNLATLSFNQTTTKNRGPKNFWYCFYTGNSTIIIELYSFKITFLSPLKYIYRIFHLCWAQLGTIKTLEPWTNCSVYRLG